MNPTEKIFFPTEKGVAEKMIQNAKDYFFFLFLFLPAEDQENIYFGDTITQKTYFNALNLVIGIISISKQILR